MSGTRLVAVDERGKRIGEGHHRAKLTNAEVDLVLTLREQGLSYSAIVRCVGRERVSRSAVAMICRFQRRAFVIARWKRVTLDHIEAEAGCTSRINPEA